MLTAMRRGKTVWVALAVLVAGCSDSTGPERRSVTGTWAGSTSGMSLSVGVTERDDGKFTGFGSFSDSRGNIRVTVNGKREGRSVAFVLSADGYESTGFNGTLADSITMSGTLNHSGFQNTPIRLYRQRAPAGTIPGGG